MKQPLIPIGTIETVGLPDFGIDDILAKVDTGADSSAIWASSVAVESGELCYHLFGPTSPFYNSEPIRTRRFTKVVVQNSFGHKEERYKVTLKLKIEDRVINARFTLANRSNHRFPILIGRRTLKGKFVVDPSRRSKALGNQRIALLLLRKGEANRAYAEALKNEGLEIDRIAYEDLEFRLGGSGNHIRVASTGTDIADYSLVYFRTATVSGHHDVAAAIAQYLSDRRVDFIDRTVAASVDLEKIYQYTVLTDNGVSIPPTIFRLPHKLAQEYEKLVAELGLPFVLKDSNGKRGQNNFLINSKTEFDRALLQAKDFDVWLLAQQYIPNDFIYRLITMGGEVALILRRGRDKGQTHLYSTARGSKVVLMDPAEMAAQLLDLAPMAAKLMGLQIAGVDLVQDKVSELWYCLEVNQAPQLYSGSFVTEKEAAVAKYLSKRLFD
jgi:glutathione synthase/RimK-type ligase-like ATP-grasp enzyme